MIKGIIATLIALICVPFCQKKIDERYDEMCVINSTVFDPSNNNTSPGSGNSILSGDTSSLGSVLMDLTLEEYPHIDFNVGMIASQVARISLDIVLTRKSQGYKL